MTLLGRNGAGKTTTLKSIMGMVANRSGSVRFEGQELIARASEHIARAGIAICPEERGIFASLSVEENLLLPPVVRPGGLSLEKIFDLFPNLKERLGSSQGTKLSGGEQQMLAIGRILRTGARLLLLDEPTEGLAPVIIQQIGKTIRALKEQGFTILLVEQNFPLRLDRRGSLLRHGAWTHHRPVRQRRTGSQCREAARLSGCVTKDAIKAQKQGRLRHENENEFGGP